MQIGVGLSLPLLATRRLGGFSPRSLFTSGVAGAWYDPSDYSTLFQDSAGTTPVTAVEQPVGLMLDKSQGLVLGSELVTNGDFSGGTGWSTGGVWVISGGAASITSSITSLSQSTLAAVVGTWYQVTFTISAFTTGGVRVEFGGVNGASRTAAGTYTQYILATSTSFLVISPIASSTLSIDNVSIKVIAGNHASQATAASRPVLRARYNQVTYSEQVDNAAWTKGNIVTTGSWVNQLTAPDGTLTADLVRPTNSSINHYALLSSSLPNAAGTYTCSLYVYAGGYTKFSLRESGSTGAYVSFDIATVSVIDSANVGSVSISASSIAAVAGSPGWYRAVVTYVYSAGITPNFGFWALSPSYTTGQPASLNWAGDGTSGIYIWGAQIVTGSSAGTYQRIAAATDYATAGFLPYLATDGTDDTLSSGNIDLTVTSKLSAVVGATKNNDSNVYAIVDFGASGGSTAGGFSMWAGSPTAGGSPVWASSFQSSAGGGTFNIISPTNFAAPATAVVSTILDTVNAGSYLRVNGALQTTSAADPTDGTFGNLPLRLSRTGANGLPGRIYQVVVVGKTLSASELASTEAYVNARTGAY